METGLRIVLLLVAFIIVAGIVWDTFRSRRKPAIKKTKNYEVDRLDEKKTTETKKNKAKLDKKSLARTQKSDYSLDKQDKTAHFKIESDDLNFDSDLDILPNDEMVIVKPSSSQNKSKIPSKGNFSHFNLKDSKTKSLSQSRTFKQDRIEDFSDDLRISDDILMEQDKFSQLQTVEIAKANHKSETKAQRQDLETVFVLNVMAKQPGMFLGKKLIDIFDDVHLFYGDMNIFHRYENADGSGKPMFSLASAIEPGIFELETLESYLTPGLTLFFSPTTRNHSIAAFELMLRTAKMLATALDGEIKDQSRRPLTLEGIERYRQNVRESVKLHRASSSFDRGN